MRTEQLDAEFAVNLLQQLADNFEVAIEILLDRVSRLGGSQDPATLKAFAPYARLTFSWIVLSLSKVEELWATYGKLASEESRQLMRAVVREIQLRQIKKFRDSEVAHLISRSTSNPWTPEELMAHAMVMMKDDMESFLLWLKPRSDDVSDARGTVIYALHRFRADILVRYPGVKITA